MTRRADLLALAARVEAAQGADPELDAEIAVTIHGGTIKWKQALGTGDSEPFIWRPSSNHVGGFMRDHVPAFTASRDAAASLAPTKWWVESICQNPADGWWHVILCAVDDKRADGEAATEANARTAAALRAMAEEIGG